MIPVAFWLIKLRGEYKQNLVILACLPCLFLGGVGSTLYHAFRMYAFFHYLDFIPIILLALILSGYFWYKVINDWRYTLLVVIVLFSFRFIPYYIFEVQAATNWAYFATGVMVFLPALIVIWRNKFAYVWFYITGIGFQLLGLYMRYLDSFDPGIFSMGTHWLWHLFTACAVIPIGYFVYFIEKKEIN